MAIQHEEVPDYPDREADYHEAQDVKENLETTPPEGEVIGHPVIMVAESYVGGDLERLTSGLRRMGLEGRGFLQPDDYFEWVGQVRRSSNFGGWCRAGEFHRAGTERKWMGTIAVEMPPEFARISLRAYAPTPAVVVLTAIFELSDNASGLLDEELRTNRYLRLEREGSVTTYKSAAHRKGEAVRAERERIQGLAEKWMAKNVPGTLSRDFPELSLPAIDFLSTRLVRPFEHTESDGRFDHRTLLSIHNVMDVWESESHQGWRVSLPWRSSDDGWTLVAGAIDDPGFVYDGTFQKDQEVKPHPREVGRLDDYFGPLLVRWALSRLASAYEGQLAQIRDAIASTPEPRRFRRSPRKAALEMATGVLSTTSFDASVFAHEVHEMAGTKWRWRRDVGDWEPVDDFARRRRHSDLASTLGRSLERRSEWITDLESRLRDQLMTSTNLEVAAVNISLQRQVFWLTLLAVGVAVVTLFATA